MRFALSCWGVGRVDVAQAWAGGGYGAPRGALPLEVGYLRAREEGRTVQAQMSGAVKAKGAGDDVTKGCGPQRVHRGPVSAW